MDYAHADAVADLVSHRTVTLAAGTPAYFAPEQAHGQQALDVRADVDEVGRRLRPGDGGPRSPMSSESVTWRSGTRSCDRRRLDVGQLDDVLRGALGFDPDDRPPTASDLGHQLSEVRDVLVADTAVRATQVGTSTSAQGASNRRWAASALAIAVLMAALTWVVLGLLD